MKPNTRVRNVSSTLQGEKVEMSIAPDAFKHIMGVLTDLYSDEEMAVLREYSTNAFDAHVEAGCPLPIEVTLPSSLSPYLKIRDYGNGLDADDIRNIYSQYGVSTKRDSDDFNGTLGLGCKSALTYTDQFTIQGIKNGHAVQVSVSREEDGSGSMTIVSEYDTDEPSGVEITVPVKSGSRFAEKAVYLFQFWNEGTVLVNGEQPTTFEGIELAPGIYATSKLDESVIVMGNVPYPFSTPYGFEVVAYVEIGEVNFVPSREALQMNTPTKQKVEEIIAKVDEGRAAASQRIVNEQTTKYDALLASLRSKDLFGKTGDITFNGEALPEEFNARAFAKQKAEAAGLEEPEDYFTWTLVKLKPNYYSRRRYSNIEMGSHYPVSIVRNTVFLTGYDKPKFTPHFRKKLEQWWNEVKESYENDGFDIERVFLCGNDELPHTDWINPKLIRSWDEVQNQKIKPAPRQDGRLSGSYTVFMDDKNQTLQADEIPTNVPMYHTGGTDYVPATQRARLQEIHPDAIFVTMTRNRVAKFERLFPHSKDVYVAINEIGQTWKESLTDEQRMHIMLREARTNGGHQSLADFDSERVDDPDLKIAIELSKTALPKKLSEEYRKYAYGHNLNPEGWTNPAEKYALLMLYLEAYFYRGSVEKADAAEHLYTYLNAAYAAESEK